MGEIREPDVVIEGKVIDPDDLMWTCEKPFIHKPIINPYRRAKYGLSVPDWVKEDLKRRGEEE